MAKADELEQAAKHFLYEEMDESRKDSEDPEVVQAEQLSAAPEQAVQERLQYKQTDAVEEGPYCVRQAVSQVVLLRTFPEEQELHSLAEGPVHTLHFP